MKTNAFLVTTFLFGLAMPLPAYATGDAEKAADPAKSEQTAQTGQENDDAAADEAASEDASDEGDDAANDENTAGEGEADQASPEESDGDEAADTTDANSQKPAEGDGSDMPAQATGKAAEPITALETLENDVTPEEDHAVGTEHGLSESHAAVADEPHGGAAHGEGEDDHGGGHHMPELPDLEWSFEGPFGTFDRASLQRGFQVYQQVCSACHGMDYLSYRNLTDIGYNEAEVKAIASQYIIMDGPNDEGEMFERARKPSDRFKNPFDNEQAARYANNGALPPDMSLLAKARPGGADYIYAVLTGYKDAPEGVSMQPGQYWNKYYPGNLISMAPPLSDDMVAYEDGTDMTMEQYSKDVSHFLMWAAEPKLEARKRTGIKVVLFLLAFAGIMFMVKKKVWKDLKTR
jgi:ubiquinol-cytochrome c reductase cytochrome c1 subunit